MAEIPDLWPYIDVEVELVTPLSILKAQAASLSRRTNNLLEGETRTEGAGQGFRHTFYIYAPSLDYRLYILQIMHPLTFYPLEASAWGDGPINIESEDEFLKWMKSVFSSDRTVRAIRSLLAQVKSA